MPKRIEVESGEVFGRLTIIRELPKHERPKTMSQYRYMECRCECGTWRVVAWSHLRSGHTTSCGCFNREVNQARDLGRRQTPVEYKAWLAIRQRCYNPNCKAYDGYGGRGIRMCKRWMESFDAFLLDMGKCPSGHTIERQDNDGDYEPQNCVWATRKAQARNTRRNRLITFGGETLCLAEWSERTGIAPSTLTKRLSQWSVKAALTTPVSERHRTIRKD